MDQVIGRCSLCDGNVVVPEHWSSGIAPPAPTCRNCGARRARSTLPVIQMEPSTRPIRTLEDMPSTRPIRTLEDMKHWYRQQTSRAVNSTQRMATFDSTQRTIELDSTQRMIELDSTAHGNGEDGQVQ